MKDVPSPIAICRRLTFVALVALGFLAALHAPAHAQHVAVFVNGEPITQLDIEQRMRLVEISTHKKPTPQEALDELIADKLKVQVGKKYGIEIPDKDIDASFRQMARRVGQSAQQFAEGLTKNGINVPALKRRIKADITWNSIIRGKFPSITNVGEKEILSAAERKTDAKASELLQYTLRPILFIVPRGSTPATIEARRHEADMLRSRFQTCEDGVAFARALTDVAVRDQIMRVSTDFTAQQREVLDATEIGHLTTPETTPQGVEMFAVCNKQAARGDTVGMAEVREAMVSERYNATAKRYLEQLRREAIIEQGH